MKLIHTLKCYQGYKSFTVICYLLLSITFTGCGGGGGVTDSNFWTWVSGSNTTYQSVTYGTKGIAGPANIPGARYSSTSWSDTSGNLWLFGGYGNDDVSGPDMLNDLRIKGSEYLISQSTGFQAPDSLSRWWVSGMTHVETRV